MWRVRGVRIHNSFARVLQYGVRALARGVDGRVDHRTAVRQELPQFGGLGRCSRESTQSRGVTREQQIIRLIGQRPLQRTPK